MLLELEISQPEDERIWLITVNGELDFHTASRFRLVFEQALPQQGEGLVLDLTDLAFLDSSGLGAILELFNHASGAGVRLAIACGNGHINRVFDVTQLHDVLGVVETRDEAMAAVAPAA